MKLVPDQAFAAYAIDAVAAAYDAMSGGYDGGYASAHNKAENEALRRILAPVLHGSKSVLDIGCGTGLLLDLFPDLVRRYAGIDISAGMLARLREKHSKAFALQLPVEQLQPPPYARLGYDLVISLFGVLDYSPDPVLAIARMLDQVKPGGTLFVMALGEAHARRDTYANAHESTMGIAPRRFTARELRRHLGDAFLSLRYERDMPLLLEPVRGFVREGFDTIPTWTGGRFLTWLLTSHYQRDGAHRPDGCYYLIAQATKA